MSSPFVPHNRFSRFTLQALELVAMAILLAGFAVFGASVVDVSTSWIVLIALILPFASQQMWMPSVQPVVVRRALSLRRDVSRKSWRQLNDPLLI
jgi:hypothetical protein